ncbi:MAG: glycosyltransferase family 39 protein [Bryobacteraceae bacterium]
MPSLKFMASWWQGTIFALTFSLLGWAILPYPGIQNDEVLFATPYFHAVGSSIFQFGIFHRRVPVMFLTYLGALKNWLCAPIFWLAPPTSWAVRVPPLLLGALTILLFVRLLETVHGRRAARIGGLLLATDTMFLLTTCFDWGPVALQHFLLLAGGLLLVKFVEQPRRRTLYWGFFCFGLAIWDKALFVWILGGLALGAILIFPRELWKRVTARNVRWAAAGFCLGALPLIVYNSASGFATFRSNSSFAFDELARKAQVLRASWNGSALLGYIASNPDQQALPQPAHSLVERLSFALHGGLGDHPFNQLTPAFCAALLLLPFLWRTRARKVLLFSLVAMAAAWFQMAIAKGAGGSAHHAVLLWPIPHLFMAVAFAEASLQWRTAGRWAIAVVVIYLAAQNLLLTNQYLYQLVRYGSPHSWTDAIYPLSDELGRMRAPQIVIEDWGILNPLVLLQKGTLPMIIVDDAFLSPGLSGALRNYHRGLLESALWVGHTPAYQEMAGTNRKILEAASSAGFRKELIETISDREGRAAFEIFGFRKTN